ncbi:hypothetical protein [Leptospira ilyithenensis]|nr:hypothetical protein [Leptospira ilyithenensis]
MIEFQKDGSFLLIKNYKDRGIPKEYKTIWFGKGLESLELYLK